MMLVAAIWDGLRKGLSWALLTGLLAGPAALAKRPEHQQPGSPAAEISSEPAINQLTTNSHRAYAEVLKLRLSAARQLLQPELTRAPTAPAPLLVANCADFAELLISQNASRYEAITEAQQARLDALDKTPAGALRDYARAEINLHLGLSQLLFKHLVAGGWHLRRGVQQMQDVVKHYPDFVPARKTLGLCQFAIGSLPEGYHWLLRLLGLSGDVEGGLRNLALAANQPHDFQTESQIYQALIRESYYKKPDDANRLVERLQAQQPDNLLFSYLLISLHKRQHHGDAALAAYRARPVGSAYVPLAYLHHMAADLLLYQSDYAGSERENLVFLREYRGVHYLKDAYFKLYLAAWLGGQSAAVMARYREQINQHGLTDIEEDNYAQHYYRQAKALNPILTRARLQIDGGYDRAALATLRSFRPTAATDLRDRVEEPYRRARAYQDLGRLDSARLAYERTLAVSGTVGTYYFGPQAALQLGYICLAAGQKAQAKAYFERALNSPWHEYKNSTDAKAKLALRGL